MAPRLPKKLFKSGVEWRSAAHPSCQVNLPTHLVTLIDTSFPRRRESKGRRLSKAMDSRLRENDGIIFGRWKTNGPAVLICAMPDIGDHLIHNRAKRWN